VTPLRGLITTLGLLFTFLLQEAGISKIHLPFSGFSLYLGVLVALVTLEDVGGAITIGFIGGVILDFSPSSTSPFGQWALIITAVSYLLAINKDLLVSFESRPGVAIIILALSIMLILGLYVLISAILGESVGSLSFVVKTILANGLWTALIAPFIIPSVSKIRQITVNVLEN